MFSKIAVSLVLISSMIFAQEVELKLIPNDKIFMQGYDFSDLNSSLSGTIFLNRISKTAKPGGATFELYGYDHQGKYGRRHDVTLKCTYNNKKKYTQRLAVPFYDKHLKINQKKAFASFETPRSSGGSLSIGKENVCLHDTFKIYVDKNEFTVKKSNMKYASSFTMKTSEGKTIGQLFLREDNNGYLKFYAYLVAGLKNNTKFIFQFLKGTNKIKSVQYFRSMKEEPTYSIVEGIPFFKYTYFAALGNNSLGHKLDQTTMKVFMENGKK